MEGASRLYPLPFTAIARRLIDGVSMCDDMLACDGISNRFAACPACKGVKPYLKQALEEQRVGTYDALRKLEL